MGFSKCNGKNSGQFRMAYCGRKFFVPLLVLDSCRHIQFHVQETTKVRFMTGREASKIMLTGKDRLVSLNLFHRKAGPWADKLASTDGRSHKRIRRMIAAPLSVDCLKHYFPFINNLAIEMSDQWSGRNMIMSLEPDGEEQEKFRELHDILCNRENGSSLTWSEVKQYAIHQQSYLHP
ncbi:unnamed protein product [Fraxinus pennsylvanica]|uniref:Cytochrome P450 n=1 Tax=Fraxinus pennsylvanica TaxID=56036 RepID=A0AAD2E7W3_9LAMI|nr:unnamed protein product [Fraxinus pennsylvanica]